MLEVLREALSDAASEASRTFGLRRAAGEGDRMSILRSIVAGIIAAIAVAGFSSPR